MTVLRRRSVLAGATAAIAAPTIVQAQAEWPKGPIRVVVPFPPGGTTDPVARLLAAKVSDNTGWQTVIDNKPGAAGAIGAGIAAKAPPDGQTWMITFDSHILSPAFTPNLAYKDSELFNVMLVGRAALAVACHPDRPYKTFNDVVADAKARPGKVSVGLLSASGALLLTAYLQKANGFELNQIYYKGGGPTVQDVLAGVTDFTVTTLGALQPHFRAGKLRPLATTGEKRAPGLPGTSHPRRAGPQDLSDLFVVGRLCADRHAAADHRPHEHRARQGRALTRRGGEVRRADRHGDHRQLAGRICVLSEERAGALVQGDQGQRHQE